jgi:hypothetical protein
MKVIFGEQNSTKNYYIDVNVGWNEETEKIDPSKVVEGIIRDGKLKLIFRFD